MDTTKRILTQAAPACISQLLNLAQQTINVIFIGQLGDAGKFAAIGVGSMVITLFGYGPYVGLNSGIETLVS